MIHKTYLLMIYRVRINFFKQLKILIASFLNEDPAAGAVWAQMPLRSGLR